MIAAAFVTSASAAVVTVSNPNPNPQVLSELVIYDTNSLPNHPPEIILRSNFLADDITVPALGTATFITTTPQILKYFISITDATGEHETAIGRVSSTAPKAFSFFQVPDTGSPLFNSVDFERDVAPPVVGTIVNFSNGRSAQLLGWFVGTGSDINLGTITGAYTGPAQVLAGLQVAVVAVPEPETYGMLIAGLGAIWFAFRRRKQAASSRSLLSIF
jgi:hypothetical protein